MSEAWGPKHWKDIRKEKWKHPRDNIVWLADGMVVRGWEGAQKAEKNGRPLRLRGLGRKDPVEFVIETHGWRLEGAEKAEAVAKCVGWLTPGRPTKYESSGLDSVKTAEMIAEFAGVSVRTVVRVKKRLRRGLVDWRTDLDAAVERVEELEVEVERMRGHLQDYADRALPPNSLSESLARANKNNRMWRRRALIAERRHKMARRDATLRQKIIDRLERRLEKHGGKAGLPTPEEGKEPDAGDG